MLHFTFLRALSRLCLFTHALYGKMIDVIISKIDCAPLTSPTLPRWPTILCLSFFFLCPHSQFSCVKQKLPVVVELLSKYSHYNTKHNEYVNDVCNLCMVWETSPLFNSPFVFNLFIPAFPSNSHFYANFPRFLDPFLWMNPWGILLFIYFTHFCLLLTMACSF